MPVRRLLHLRGRSLMLPRPLRVTSAADHRRIGRGGVRVGTSSLVVHLVNPPAATRGPVALGVVDTSMKSPARAGIVVGRAVGNSVVRHLVSRRLRHLLAARLPGLPPGTELVVRANAGAATATSVALGADLDRALARARRPARAARPRVEPAPAGRSR